MDGMVRWRSISSFVSDSDTRMENWKQRLHEISTRRCARMTCALRWIDSEVREPPIFYGQNNLEEFLTKFELEVLDSQRLLVLDTSLK